MAHDLVADHAPFLFSGLYKNLPRGPHVKGEKGNTNVNR